MHITFLADFTFLEYPHLSEKDHFYKINSSLVPGALELGRIHHRLNKHAYLFVLRRCAIYPKCVIGVKTTERIEFLCSLKCAICVAPIAVASVYDARASSPATLKKLKCSLHTTDWMCLKTLHTIWTSFAVTSSVELVLNLVEMLLYSVFYCFSFRNK